MTAFHVGDSEVGGDDVVGGLTAVVDPPDVPSPAATTLSLEVAFGHGPGSVPDPGDWIDITDYLHITPTSPGITAYTGRSNGRAGITPGSLRFTLENFDGRFNPRNTAGPYYGDLVNGVQVRVRTTYDDTTRTRWLGFVDSGWPQQITSRLPLVDVTAHDLFGLLAQGEAPVSAWEAWISGHAYQPDHWWKPGVDGWTDVAAGLSARHTGKLVQADGDNAAIIDGEPAAWGQPDVDGYGIVDASAGWLDASDESLTILARFRLATEATRNPLTGGAASPVILLHQAETNDESPLTILVYPDYVQVFCGTEASDRSLLGEAGSTNLWDYRPHTIVLHLPESTGVPRLWIDGREVVDALTNDIAASRTHTLGPLYIGHNPLDPFNQDYPYVGDIDPIVIWRGYAGDLTALAADSHDAMRQAWAGQRLDQRVSNIAEAVGLVSHVGTFDVSGIVTLQGYRQGEPLQLLQAVEDTEQGRLWVDRDGDIRFSARSWASDDSVSAVPQVTFSDDPTLLDGGAQEMLEDSTVIVDDPFALTNVAAVNSTNGRQQIVEDAASIAKYGRRNSVQLSGLLHPSDRQSRSIAEWLVLSQSEPRIEARQVAFRVEDNPTVLAPLAATIEPGWLVRIRKTTSAEALDLYAHVIGIENRWTFTGWVCVLTLDDSRAGYSFFEWGSSNWGGSDGWAF